MNIYIYIMATVESLKFDRDKSIKYCIELYEKINISLYHYADKIKKKASESNLLDNIEEYNNHLSIHNHRS